MHRLRYGNLALFVEDAKLEILRTSVKSCTPEGDTLLNDEGVERKASVASTATAVDAPAASPSISAEPDDSSFKSDFDRIVSFFRDAYVEVKGTQWNDEDLWDRLEGKVGFLISSQFHKLNSIALVCLHDASDLEGFLH